jgi:transposase
MEKQMSKNNNSLKQHVFNMLSAGSDLKEVKRFLTSKRVKARLAVSMIHEQAIAVQNTEYQNYPAYS